MYDNARTHSSRLHCSNIILNLANCKVKDHCNKITLMQVNNRINQNSSLDALLKMSIYDWRRLYIECSHACLPQVIATYTTCPYDTTREEG